MKAKLIIVNDKMQKNYRYYLTESSGRNFDREFAPSLSPKEMLELGVFGGKYLTDCQKEFPKSWFKKAKLSPSFVLPILKKEGELDTVGILDKKLNIVQIPDKPAKKAIRRSALDIKKAEEVEQDKRLAQEQEWEIPAFLRRVKFKS